MSEEKVDKIIEMLKDLSRKYKETKNYAKYLDLLLSDFISRALRVLEIINEHLTRLESEIEVLKTKQASKISVPGKPIEKVSIPSPPITKTHPQVLIPFSHQTSSIQQPTKTPQITHTPMQSQTPPVTQPPSAQKTSTTLSSQAQIAPTIQPKREELQVSTETLPSSRPILAPSQSPSQTPGASPSSRASARAELLAQLREHLKLRARAKKLA